jgi:uncharacterized repeat protein (TIGR01451 family)
MPPRLAEIQLPLPSASSRSRSELIATALAMKAVVSDRPGSLPRGPGKSSQAGEVGDTAGMLAAHAELVVGGRSLRDRVGCADSHKRLFGASRNGDRVFGQRWLSAGFRAAVRACGWRSLLVAFVGVGCLGPVSAASAATTFTVNDQADAALATSTGTSCVSTDGGQCTLRAAIQAADNVGSGNGLTTITLPAGTYKLTIVATSGLNTDDPATGDLDIDHLNAAPSAPQITIAGAGADSTFIDANSVDRAFTVQFPSSLSISGATIEGGAPSSHAADHFNGGAINAAGPLTIDDSVLAGNSAGGEGGAVYSTADVTVRDSAVVNNVAPTAGGALANAGSGVITLIDDTFDANKATGMTGAGGALAYLYPAAGGSVIENVTIAHNTAPLGGGIYNPSYAVGIENTVVAENSDAGSLGGAANCYGNPAQTGPAQAAGADLGGNVDSDGTCFSPATAHNLTSTDPKLAAALGDNGGPTPTDALLAGSPAIGHAIASACTAADQRGVPRLGTFCDPGAYQTIDADLALTADGPSSIDNGRITDTFTVSNGGPNAATDVKFSDPVPNGTTATAVASQGSCAVTSTVSCSLGTLNSALTGAAQTATVTVVLTPTQTGTVDNVASVSASPLDPVAANNSASISTDVMPPTTTVTVGDVHVTPVEATFEVACGSRNPSLIPVCELFFVLSALGSSPGAAPDIVTAANARGNTHHRKVIVVGRAKAKIQAGRKKTVEVKLNRTGRRLLAKHHTLKVKLTITQDGHLVRSRTITFKANRPSKHKHN